MAEKMPGTKKEEEELMKEIGFYCSCLDGEEREELKKLVCPLYKK